MENYLFWIAPAASFLALALAAFFYKQMKGESEGTPEMQKSPNTYAVAQCLTSNSNTRW